jgi:multidrug efflux pump subunit AcrB
MNIPELCIRRPVMTTLVMAGILLFGAMAYRALPVSELPNVDFPTIQVTANLPGSSPEPMASSVATPLEREFSTIAGLDSMSSISALGLTQITLQFSLERDIDAVAQDVQTSIAKAARLLPPDMPTPPYFRKVNPADMPILYLALGSKILPLSTVNEYADTLMAQRISMISGVAQVLIYGAQKYAVRIRVNPDALSSAGIGINEVEKAIAEDNVNLPTGTLYGRHKAVTIQTTGQLTEAKAYRPLIVAYRKGSPVTIEEVATVIDSVENDKTAGWVNDTRGITLAIQRQPGTNTIEVASAVKKLLPTFQAQLPASIELSVLYDRSLSIHESVADVQFTLVLATALVILVIFLFLRNLSATLIPSLALPMSIVGTFAVMYLMDYSLDNLSLMALTLSPMLCSRFLKPPKKNPGRLYAASEKIFQGMLKAYEVTLKWVLRHRVLTMIVFFALLAWSIHLFMIKVDLSIYAFVGVIMLIGIVKKNAIMMIDFALNAQRNEGKGVSEAIFEGCILRFRPIMMTTMAALMGTLPIAMGIGVGGEARQPLGLAVVGGLVLSQLLTLYLTPVIYIYMDGFQRRVGRLFQSRRALADAEVLD